MIVNASTKRSRGFTSIPRGEDLGARRCGEAVGGRPQSGFESQGSNGKGGRNVSLAQARGNGIRRSRGHLRAGGMRELVEVDEDHDDVGRLVGGSPLGVVVYERLLRDGT